MDKSKFKIKKEWQKFGYGLSVILLVIGSVQLYLGSSLYIYFYSLSLFILMAALVFPLIIKPLFILFSYFGFGMNWLVTHLVLTIVFYLVMTPLGLLLRLFGKKLLDVKFSKQNDSYWINREDRDPVRESFTKQY